MHFVKIISAAAISISAQLALVGPTYATVPDGKGTPTQEETIRLQQIVDMLERKSDAKVTDKIVSEIQQALSAHPVNSTARLALALCYDRLGMGEMAKQQYDLAAEQAPNDPRILMELLKAQARQGQLKAAMATLESAYRRFPNDPETMFWYANYLRTTERQNEAESLYKKVIGTKHILGLGSALAQIRMQQGLFRDAQIMADKDLQIDHNFPLAHYLKGQALMKLRNYEEAVKPLSIAFDHDPFKPDLASLYSYACYWTGDHKTALEPALVNLATKSSLTSNSSSAKEAVRRVIVGLPNTFVSEKITMVNALLSQTMQNAAYHFALGDVLDSVGMYEPAIEEYQAGLTIEPTFARGIFRLGKDLELYRHEYPEALYCYEKAHMLSPRDLEISAHLERLTNRVSNRKVDIAWQIRDWLSTHPAMAKR